MTLQTLPPRTVCEYMRDVSKHTTITYGANNHIGVALVGQHVLGTDGHILLRLPQEAYDYPLTPVPSLLAEKLMSVWRYSEEKCIELPYVALLDPYLPDVYTGWQDDDVKCTECDGNGEVEWSYKGWTKDFNCPKCKGDGLVSTKIAPSAPSAPYADISLGEVRIAAHYMGLLHAIAASVGCPLVVVSTKNHRAYFKTGPVQALVMERLLGETVLNPYNL
jgi:hypothetical protein